MASTWSYTKDFNEVYLAEVKYIKERRARLGLLSETLSPEKDGEAPKLDHGTVGLALSGGGIRSATFSLGVLQALVRLDLLKYVDYLSTVSGGGYLGSCITSLLTADQSAGVRPAQCTTHPFPLGFEGADRERPEVQHLRNYSNYIAPRHGPFKIETWRLVAWYSGALVFNLICPLAVIVFILIPGTFVVVRLWEHTWLGWPVFAWIVIGFAISFLAELGLLFFTAKGQAERDAISKKAAYAAALFVIPGFLFLAPSTYDWLVKLTWKTTTFSNLKGWLNPLLALLSIVIPPAFLGYVRGSLRTFGFVLLGLVSAIVFVHFLGWLYEQNLLSLRMWLIFSGIAIVSGFVININRVSLLNFYRDRLADCYVIKRVNNGSAPPIVTNENLKLAELLPEYNGPYHLLNGTLNLSGSKDLALRGRMAATFLFSKFYCGSPKPEVGYSPTHEYVGGELDLATAMAVSGAAVSAQQGSLTRPGLAALMALLNLRLGQWLPRPAEKKMHRFVWWNSLFAKELFSQVDENDWFVFVSDGGHFENLGVYSLLQRRCRTIIAVDAGADPERKFEDLAGLIRKARIDFGIQIEIDLSKLHGDPLTKRAERGFAVGKIVYPENSQHPGGEGCFVYIKPTLTMTGSESEDLLEYGRNHSTFPQETTADQFFDEAQFESYRELGYTITKSAFKEARFDLSIL